MAYIKSLLASALLLSTANAHFQLISPPSLPSESHNQATAPCGGAQADLSQNTATDFHVDGQHVQVFLGHAQGTWLIRATLDDKAGGSWTQVFPIWQQSGRGNFCEPVVTVPSDWAGKKGFIGLNSNAGDGVLYQCAAVNFVSGSAPAPEAGSCVNGTAISAVSAPDAELSALVEGSSNTQPPTESSSSGPSSGAQATAPPGSAASSLMGAGFPLGSFVATGVMLLIGAAVL
ncbi:hypothetical protein QBC44DRAFT_385086 [Cladorrhinum sp. PSN332]|nr:hypothetical protein QBC44DRAFT_385086 [Cladorrhinum sp. PSN332]